MLQGGEKAGAPGGAPVRDKKPPARRENGCSHNLRTSMDQQTLGTALKTIADEQWLQRRQPVFLSSLPPLLAARGLGDYKQALGGLTLKQFVKDSGPTYGCKLVEHPTLRAKLALVPWDVPFDFGADAPPAPAAAITRADVETFFKVLAAVAEDGNQLMLPASFVAKLVAIR